MSYTPGPWLAAQADPSNPEDWQVEIGGWPYGSFYPADARLIAEAPNLLAKAEAYLERFDLLFKPVGLEDEDRALRAAIAAAKGEA